MTETEVILFQHAKKKVTALLVQFARQKGSQLITLFLD